MKGNPKIQVRFLVCFSTWFGLLVLYMHRSNISVSVLTMIAPDVNNKDSPCIGKGNGNSKAISPPIPVAFSWDAKFIGTVLGCFFYGYAFTHIIGGLLASKIGARKTMALTLFGSSVAQIISVPLADQSVYAFIFARVMSGVFSGPIIPVIHEIVSIWSPPEERTTLAVFTHTGNVFGLIVNYGIGGFIAESSERGWGLFFYVSGALGLLSCLMWYFLGFDRPGNHPYISDEEYTHITKKHRNADGKDDSDTIGFKDIPFREIFKSIPAWTCHFGQMANNFLLYGLLTGHPKFLKDVYGFSPKKASTLSMIPFVVSFVVQMGYSKMIDYFIRRNPENKTKLRKMSSFFGFVVAGIFISCVGFVKCDQPYIAVLLVSLSMACYGANTSGYFTSIIDMAPRYAGIVMGLSNTLGSVSGIANPEIVNLIVSKSIDARTGWKNAFIATGVITIATGFPYLLFGSSELQPWAYHDIANNKKNDEALEMDSTTNKEEPKEEPTEEVVEVVESS